MLNEKPIHVCGGLMQWRVRNRVDRSHVRLYLEGRGGNWCAFITHKNEVAVCSVQTDGMFADVPPVEPCTYETENAAVDAVMARLIERGFIDPIDYVAWASK